MGITIQLPRTSAGAIPLPAVTETNYDSYIYVRECTLRSVENDRWGVFLREPETGEYVICSAYAAS